MKQNGVVLIEKNELTMPMEIVAWIKFACQVPTTFDVTLLTVLIILVLAAFFCFLIQLLNLIRGNLADFVFLNCNKSGVFNVFANRSFNSFLTHF